MCVCVCIDMTLLFAVQYEKSELIRNSFYFLYYWLHINVGSYTAKSYYMCTTWLCLEEFLEFERVISPKLFTVLCWYILSHQLLSDLKINYVRFAASIICLLINEWICRRVNVAINTVIHIPCEYYCFEIIIVIL